MSNSLSAPPVVPGFDWRRAGWLALVVGLIALAGLGTLGFIGWNIGPIALVVGIVTAILPVPVLVACFLWLDRYEPEPWTRLAFAFAWGACVATALALAVNTFADWLFGRLGWPTVLVAVFVAPFIEEIGKAAGPFLIFIFRRKDFSGLVDGIVYTGLSATGFAMTENILYLGGFFRMGADRGGVLGGAVLVVILFAARIVMSGFAHPLFTSMVGVGLGVAARASDRRIRWLAPLAGLLGAMLLHGGWNYMATVGSGLLAFGYVGVIIPILIAVIGVALWARSWEGQVVGRVLPAYVRAGWFSPPEIGSLATVGRRLAARRWARRFGGEPAFQAMRGYQYAATRLAVVRDARSRGLADPDFAIEEQLLLSTIAEHRRVFTGRDPSVPPASWDGQAYRVTFPDGHVRALPAPTRPVMPIPLVPMPLMPGPMPGPRSHAVGSQPR